MSDYSTRAIIIECGTRRVESQAITRFFDTLCAGDSCFLLDIDPGVCWCGAGGKRDKDGNQPLGPGTKGGD